MQHKQSLKILELLFDNYYVLRCKILPWYLRQNFATLHNKKWNFVEEVSEQLYDAVANQFLSLRIYCWNFVLEMWQWRKVMAINVKNVDELSYCDRI
jgi:hypothetical protein